MINRDTDIAFMRQALLEARKAEAAAEVPVGAVLVQDGQIIGRGHNLALSNHDPSAHAEIMALRDAGQTIANYRLSGATLYVSLEPCIMCAGAILHGRVDRLVYAARDERFGAAGTQLNLLQSVFLNHRTSITAGVLAAESRQLLQSFFDQRR